ncbi:hypothetical protein C1645_837853 [Glomus cerebriforme]|uniref:Uncharacterized protein n=1 Tax=Glomus cerebriforme TaxID=658196 RepID=A0A397SA98_9GLOM|nr:hypothetical protein C1645_837853 [Glomus cerebriforme]
MDPTYSQNSTFENLQSSPVFTPYDLQAQDNNNVPSDNSDSNVNDHNDYNVTASAAEQTNFDNYLEYNVQPQIHQPSQPYVDNNNTVNVKDQQIRPQLVFFFKPYNDFYSYHVKCEEISSDMIVKILNNSLINKDQFNDDEIIFFYSHHYNNRIYQITCEIISPTFIINFLNKNIYGFDIQQQIIGRELLEFTFEQKQNLEFHLSNYLNYYLLI